MKILLRVPGTVLALVVIATCALFDAIREHRQKRRLGPAYEGPLED